MPNILGHIRAANKVLGKDAEADLLLGAACPILQECTMTDMVKV